MSELNLRDRIRKRPVSAPLPDLRQETGELPFQPDPPPASGPVHAFRASREQVRTSIPTEPIEEESEDPASAFNALKAPRQSLLQRLDVNKKMLMIALGLAAVASLMTVSYINDSAGVLSRQSKLIPVVVAKKDIPARTVITSDMVSIKEVPALYVLKRAVAADTPVVGKIAAATIFEGEQLVDQRVTDPNADTGLAMIIPAGHRALTISGASAALIKPSDYIDIIATVPHPRQYGQVLTVPALQRCLVLAVDDQISSTGVSGGRGQSLTIAVPEKKVNLMTLLESKGSFKVVLRGKEETTFQADTMSDREIENLILGREDRPKPAAVAPKPAPPKVERVYVEVPARATSRPVRRSAPVRRQEAPRRPVEAPPSKEVTVTVINGTQVTQQKNLQKPQN